MGQQTSETHKRGRGRPAKDESDLQTETISYRVNKAVAAKFDEIGQAHSLVKELSRHDIAKHLALASIEMAPPLPGTVPVNLPKGKGKKRKDEKEAF